MSLLETDNGWRVITNSGEIEDYDSDGRLIRLGRLGGGSVSLEYDAEGRLSTVSDSAQRELNFSYNSDNRISGFAAPDGSYGYTYDDAGNLTSITFPDGNTRQYHYESPHNTSALTSITDEEGRRVGPWEYDDTGRVTRSAGRTGDGMFSASYTPGGETTVVNPLGKKTTYRFEPVNGRYRLAEVIGEPTEHCQGGGRAYEYTSDGLIRSKTDWDGTVTTYAYNERGLRTHETESAGTELERTTITEWHPELPLRTRVTESGRVTEYEYDDDGRLVSRRVRSVEQE